MKKTNIIYHLWSLLLVITPFILIAIFWNSLSDQIPKHWNISGEVDRYGDKREIFLLPGINVFIYVLLWIIPYIDPKKNFGQFLNTFVKIQALVITFLFGIFLVILVGSLGYAIDMGFWILYLVIGLLLVIGNYLGKVRPNYFLGIRTPWTLESEEVWVKTHRLAGKLWVVSMILLAITGLFLKLALFNQVFVVVLITVALIPVIYSYILYTRLDKVNSEI